MLRRVGQERYGAGTLYGHRKPALVLGARAALPVPQNLLTVVQVVPQEIDILVVDDLDGIAAEIASAAAARPATARSPPALPAETASTAASAATAEPSRRPTS